jgi:hypothetical protein
MVDKLPTNQPGANSPIKRVGETQPTDAGKASESSEGGPAFKALLDKLQEQARTLHKDSETLAKPEELSGAVDRARSSLSDALSLSDKLLEAYREAVQSDGSDQPEDGGDPVK